MWFLDLWRAGGWDGRAPVTRIEMRYTRDFLREIRPGRRDSTTMTCWTGWAICGATVPGVAALLCPTPTDVNRARWPLHPLWEVIQHANFGVMPSCPVVRGRSSSVSGADGGSSDGLCHRLDSGLDRGTDGERSGDVSLVFRWFCDEVEQPIRRTARAVLY